MEEALESKLKLGRHLICVFHEVVTKDDALLALAARLLEGGFVRESFARALLDREKTFPTGLPTEPVGVAIPHTDPEHVLASALAVGILPHPVAFQEMGSPEVEIDASIISMMAISDSGSVMPILRSLALAYQDQEFLALLSASRSEDRVLDLFQARIPEVIELI